MKKIICKKGSCLRSDKIPRNLRGCAGLDQTRPRPPPRTRRAPGSESVLFYHEMIMFMLIIKDQESVIAMINISSDFYEELENHKCMNVHCS